MRQLFDKEIEELPVRENYSKLFDKKYKTIIETKMDSSYYEKIEWLHSSSSGDVSVKPLDDNTRVLIGFEKSDDALFFKIKYSI